SSKNTTSSIPTSGLVSATTVEIPKHASASVEEGSTNLQRKAPPRLTEHRGESTLMITYKQLLTTSLFSSVPRLPHGGHG
ncbi:hypothetical protein HID58_054951, partial [Brassica napus]